MKRGIRLVISIIFIGLILCCIAMAVWTFIRTSDTEGIAREAFDLINEHRVENELSPLAWDEQLAELAIEHSEYMEKTGNFTHSNYPYMENILESSGGYPSGNSVINPWMMSRGHRANILNGIIHFGAIGIAGDYATFIAR